MRLCWRAESGGLTRDCGQFCCGDHAVLCRVRGERTLRRLLL